MEELAELGIRGRAPQLQAQCLGQGTVVADDKALQISQALAAAQNPENGHQQQLPGGKAHATVASVHLVATSDN